MYKAQYCGKQCMAKKENSKKEISKKLLKQERKFLDNLDHHPCIVQLLTTLGNPKSPMLLMERMWMSLTEFLSDKQTHHIKGSILCDVARGLCYIHEKNIIHCDLTGDHILLTENITAKLSDFGRATFCKKNIKYLPESLDHMPPEIFKPCSQATYSAKVDVFSFGCIIIHTFTQELPVPDFDKFVETTEVKKFIKHSEVERRSTCLKKFKIYVNAVKLHDIVLKCLHDNPDHRPTAEALLLLLEKQAVSGFINNPFKKGLLNT